ncbi:MAG: hypothetical protein K0Q59_2962 [Paenibacillus sp.]|jgi:hypothetical protein|nr:hypothetical protein [Paenibacillus sp.]
MKTKIWSRLAAALLLSAGLAAALSVVPKLDGSLSIAGPDSSVFRPDPTIALSDRNLVDLFARFPLQLGISHVEWNDAILSIDLKSYPGTMTESVIYNDLFHIARLVFEGTNNVSQMLVRVMEPSSSGSGAQLLLAMDAKRSDVAGSKLSSLDMQSNKAKEQFISSHFSLTYTHRWMDQRRS